ncbi:CorA family divalent cation transporter [Acidaminobacter hydrogenoformans]|nr:CorA family divalent cation transporter [Acidaminobacter hydrogenoformans]
MEKLNRDITGSAASKGEVHYRGYHQGQWRLLPEDAPLDDVNWIDVRGRISEHDWSAIAAQLGLELNVLLDKVESGQHSQYFFDPQCEGIIARVLMSASPKFNLVDEAEENTDLVETLNNTKLSLSIGQLTVIKTKEAVLTMTNNADALADHVMKRYHEADETMDHEYFIYLLLDSLIDEYYHVMIDMETRYELLEDMILIQKSTKHLGALHDFRKTLFTIRNAASNLHDALENRMMDREGSHSVYMRELYEHLRSIEDYALYFREGITSLIEIMLTMNDNRLNEIMTTLTVFASIFIPLTFLTGVYGMNFDYMPELRMKFAYPSFWLLTIALTLFMIRYFKRRAWL